MTKRQSRSKTFVSDRLCFFLVCLSVAAYELPEGLRQLAYAARRARGLSACATSGSSVVPDGISAGTRMREVINA